MTWKTHMVVGANSLWFAALFNNIENSILILLPVALVASILPDIDAAGGGAKIHYIGGGILSNFKNFHGKYFHHRGIMHSFFVALVFLVVIFFVNIIFLNNLHPLLPFIFTLSYLSHSLIDGFNTGVGYFYPFNLKKYGLIPYLLRTPVKGFADNLLFIIGAFGIMLFFLIFRERFFPIEFLQKGVI